MSKFVLKAIAAAALAATGVSSFAAVTISASPVVPVAFAKEITGTAPITLANPANALDLTSAIGYTMSNGEVRTVRFELPAGNTFAAGATVTTSLPALVAGAINGLGTNVITFSVTANGAVIPSATTITITGDRTVTSTAATVTASYGLYDQPSQGIAGGATGRITGNTAPVSYITFANSYEVVATAVNAIADVSATPTAFGKFVAQAAPSPNSTATAVLGSLEYKLVGTVPLKANGTAVALADLMAVGAAGTKLVVTGDFSQAANAAAPLFTGAALNRVFLSATQNCATVDVAASAVDATTATFNVGAAATTANKWVCYTPNGGAIPVASYTSSLNAVSATPASYTVSNIASVIGAISRNGTELQAPLFQVTPGYVSRFVLTNTGSSLANYTVVVRGEAGATLATGTLSGTISAGSMRVFDASTILTSVTGGVGAGAPRAFAVFTVDRPTSEIQGAYQVVNPTTGAVSQSVLIRPGTN